MREVSSSDASGSFGFDSAGLMEGCHENTRPSVGVLLSGLFPGMRGVERIRICRTRRKDFPMKYLVSVVLVFVLVGIAEAGTKQGNTEISLATSWMRVDLGDMLGVEDVEVDGVVSALGVGHFFSDELELGISATGIWMAVDEIDVGAYSIGGNLKYHFLTDGPVVPYAGVQANYTYADVTFDSVDGMLCGPLGGVKFFLSESTSIFVEYQYHIYVGDIHDLFDDGHQVLVGLSFAF